MSPGRKFFAIFASLSLTLFSLFLTLAPTSAAPSSQTGVPWVGSSGITLTTGQLMERQKNTPTQSKPPVKLHPPKPHFKKDIQDSASQSASSSGSTGQKPESPSAPQTLGTTFTGSTYADKSLAPPDTMGDAGPSQYTVVVNNRLRTFNKNSGLTDGALDLDPDVFWASVKTQGASTGDQRCVMTVFRDGGLLPLLIYLPAELIEFLLRLAIPVQSLMLLPGRSTSSSKIK
jgi:hypothetical protein